MQHVQQMVADAASKVPAFRQPTPDALTAALKDVALYKAPGFYVLDSEAPQVLQDVNKLKVQAWRKSSRRLRDELRPRLCMRPCGLCRCVLAVRIGGQ